ncbi:ATP-grasp domain-containing protein [Massilia sp. CCM 9210]|uniref:ATP-grasp domain-containing protein n=1 Tax=Massilia scottii TaxID=3057166 RepID=UPI00279693B8|nr:ATP-grasp domain-containing protein [Massilia sp. CCM 9210]MDQ1812875.1 ATP-grasp domain-containing protein [Massilia sp. CCM 9210]
MHWILQDGFLSETGWDALIANLERFGIAYSVHAVVPKTGELLPPPGIDHANVICIGSYSMRHVAAKHGWIPGVFDLYAQDFGQQRAHWGHHMLNAGAVVTTVRDARFSGEQMFVRPINDSKYFSGRVFDANAFSAWQSAVCDPAANHATSLAPDTLIQLSRPVAIYAEYRFWIVGGDIVTQSLYKRGSQVMYSSDVDERLTQFVSARSGEWSPHDAFVIDACDCANGMKIVEINTLNSSGFYAADVQRLVLALDQRYTVK